MSKLSNSKLFYVILFACCTFLSIQLVQKSNIANYSSALLANMDALASSEDLDDGEGGGITCSPPPQGLCQMPVDWEYIFDGYILRKMVIKCECTGIKDHFCLLGPAN